MKTAIIYKSYHRMNTEKVAKAMAEAVGATMVKVEDARIDDLSAYDLIGFGSGIYAGRPHRSLFTLVEKIDSMKKKAFIFSTSGKPKEEYHRLLREQLKAKGCQIVGEFQCQGQSGLLGFTFANRGHPDEKDLQDARAFIKGLVSG
ncbi:MAG: flavodoxin family protein [Methanomicrobiales archaeon]|nr:flavodoxin family protein [Methanomicrobiales archaeon]